MGIVLHVQHNMFMIQTNLYYRNRTKIYSHYFTLFILIIAKEELYKLTRIIQTDEINNSGNFNVGMRK